METNLFQLNHPKNFWMCQTPIPDTCWQEAIQKAAPVLDLPTLPHDINQLLAQVLGEGQFGENHWQLSFAKRMYYQIKPLIPRAITRVMRKGYSGNVSRQFLLNWPIEPRYAQFLWEVMHQVLILNQKNEIPFIHFWPEGKPFSLVLTHDIETAIGQKYVRTVADLEERMGFRSSFNFVPERYPLDEELIKELKARGFEVGIHGLKHDGKLYLSRKIFEDRCKLINQYLKRFEAVGFRSPLTHRNPEWMQALEIEYDLSFFDTDPYEPVPGGTMCIWPFQIGHFTELPYTLLQDYTLSSILGCTTAEKWVQKVEFIEKYHGMALINTHPDYLLNQTTWDVYHQFLTSMKEKIYWHALPRDVARWWRYRSSPSSQNQYALTQGRLSLAGEQIIID
jgi:peptidoglycan/xylan/chitin deacetylase (PgdA/CDA1 family)